MSYVRVVTQSVLITFTFFLCWFWNMLFRMIIANHSPFPPWLVPLQVDPHRVSLSSPLSPADLLAWCSRLQQLHHLAALHPPGDPTGPPPSPLPLYLFLLPHAQQAQEKLKPAMLSMLNHSRAANADSAHRTQTTSHLHQGREARGGPVAQSSSSFLENSSPLPPPGEGGTGDVRESYDNI
jgi:hypothetical protein